MPTDNRLLALTRIDDGALASKQLIGPVEGIDYRLRYLTEVNPGDATRYTVASYNDHVIAVVGSDHHSGGMLLWNDGRFVKLSKTLSAYDVGVLLYLARLALGVRCEEPSGWRQQRLAHNTSYATSYAPPATRHP